MQDLIYRGGKTPEDAHLLESKILFDRFNSKDCEEGVKSFMEKRQVKFEGSLHSDGPTAWPWWNTNYVVYPGKPKL